jgi:hypothetical protein
MKSATKKLAYCREIDFFELLKLTICWGIFFC